MPSASLGRVNVKFEGLNGKLPNLDLINTVERLFIREGLKITIQEKSRELGINEWSRYLHSLKTMLSMVWHQAPGTPTGNHGYFHKYNIEAVTIQGMKGKVKKPFEFSDTGRVLEGIFRSLNNLLERFHQSFFFYLLPSPNRYVSIGVYMPPFGVMVLPIVIKALASWISLSGDPIADETKKGKHETEGQFKSGEENVTTEVTEQQSKDSNPSPDKPVSSVIPDAEPKRVEDFVTTEVVEQQSNQSPDESVSATIPDDENQKGLDKLSHVTVFLISLLTGVGSFYAADFFVESAHKFDLTQEEGLAIGFLVTHVLAMLQPFIFKRQVLKGLNGTLKLDRNFLNCFTLLFFGISIGTISVMNISMAFLVAAAWVPVIFVNKATNFRLLAVLKYLVIICVSPFSLLFIGCMVNQVLAGFNDNLVTLLGKAWTDLQDGLMLSAFQFYLSDNWTFPLLNFVFLPIWSLFWFVATVD